jgi:hypothetical protein
MFLGRDFLSSDLFHRLVERLELDERLDRARAARIVLQVMTFVAAVADRRNFAHSDEFPKYCAKIAKRLVSHRWSIREIGQNKDK